MRDIIKVIILIGLVLTIQYYYGEPTLPILAFSNCPFWPSIDYDASCIKKVDGGWLFTNDNKAIWYDGYWLVSYNHLAARYSLRDGSIIDNYIEPKLSWPFWVTR